MPELAAITTSLIDGVTSALDASERKALDAQVAAVSKLAGKEPGVDAVQQLFAAGWLPDYFAASEIEVAAQLAMSTTRLRSVDAQGGVTLGPVTLTGRMTNSLQQTTGTNLAVTIHLARQSRSQALSNAFDALQALPAAALPPKS